MDRYDNAPWVMFPWSLAYEEYRLQIVLFGLKVRVCPYTRSDDIMVLVRPLLASSIPVPVPNPNPAGLVQHPDSHTNEIFYVTTMALPSVHPQFAVITVFEEAVLNRLLTSLADGIIFDARLEPEHLHPDATLLCIPYDVIDSEPGNANNVIQALREEVSGHANQMTLAGILHSHNVDAHTVLDALTEYFHNTKIRRG